DGPAPELESLGGSMDLALTKPGVLLGTPCYMAPELHMGAPATEASDQYAFCVALYEAWCRRRPFHGDDEVELVAQKQSGVVPPPPRDAALPRHAFDVLRRGLRPRPADRFASMRALLDALA